MNKKLIALIALVFFTIAILIACTTNTGVNKSAIGSETDSKLDVSVDSENPLTTEASITTETTITSDSSGNPTVTATSIVAEKSDGSKNWTLIGTDHYIKLQMKFDNPILMKVLQDKDYRAIDQELIAETKKEKYKGMEVPTRIDPNSNPDSGVSSDDEYLGEDWINRKNAKAESRTTLRLLKEDKGQGLISSEFETQIETPDGVAPVKVKVIEHEGKTFALSGINTPDGKNSFFAEYYGIWKIDVANKTLKRAIPDKYNGKSYEDLQNILIENNNEGDVSWNDAVIPSPDSKKLTYISNKHDILNGGKCALYLYDITTGEESIVKAEEGASYYPDFWLNSKQILCHKYKGDLRRFDIINIDGSTIPVKLEGDPLFIYSCNNDNLLAYTENIYKGPDIPDTMHIIKIVDNSIQSLKDIKVPGMIVHRGIKGFSPDSTKIGIYYAPLDNDKVRFIQVYNFTTGETMYINNLPDNFDSVREFDWLDNDTLLIVTNKNDKEELSSWTYNIQE